MQQQAARALRVVPAATGRAVVGDVGAHEEHLVVDHLGVGLTDHGAALAQALYLAAGE